MNQAAGDTLLNALVQAIGIVNNGRSQVYLLWPERVSLQFAEMLVRGDDRCVESVYQCDLNTGSTTALAETEPPAPLEDQDAGVPQINWTPTSRLLWTRLLPTSTIGASTSQTPTPWMSPLTLPLTPTVSLSKSFPSSTLK
jgi:hypothetical protein